jgi:radical SAM superfamily enzyme YgiQ (UPF0313 family)
MRLVSPGPDFVSVYELEGRWPNADVRNLLAGAQRLGLLEWDLEEWVRVPGNDAPSHTDILDVLKAAEAALALETSAGPETDADLRRRIMQRLQTQPGAFATEPEYGVAFLDTELYTAKHEHLDRIADMHGVLRRTE